VSRQDSGCDVSNDKLAMQRLREAAEKAKRELDGLAQTEVSLPFITADASGPKHMSIKVTKAQFEKLAEKLVERTMGPMEKCLKDASVKTKDVDEVLLVGGMTRMPRVQEKVKQFFGKEPSRGVNPDEVVAMGAAIQVRAYLKHRLYLEERAVGVALKPARGHIFFNVALPSVLTSAQCFAGPFIFVLFPRSLSF